MSLTFDEFYEYKKKEVEVIKVCNACGSMVPSNMQLTHMAFHTRLEMLEEEARSGIS